MCRQREATANYKCLFFLDVGRDALWPSENSNESHMVSYCSVIKAVFLKILYIYSFNNLDKNLQNSSEGHKNPTGHVVYKKCVNVVVLREICVTN